MNAPTDQPVSVAQGEQTSAEASQILAAIVSELCEVDQAQIGGDFVLASSGRLRSSLGRATLDAKIRRRLGVRIENLHALRTFGELEAAVAGSGSGVTLPAPQVPEDVPALMARSVPQPSVRKPVAMVPLGSGLACGIDVESVSALPDAKDYWEEPFYKDNFTPAEIAYCVSQSSPRMHFAARWCAKEAFKKCVVEYSQMEMNRIEVVRQDSGSPFLQVLAPEGARKPPMAVSLTHTEDWALALVVRGGDLPPVARPNSGGEIGGSRLALGLSVALSLAALVCSLLALILALMQR